MGAFRSIIGGLAGLSLVMSTGCAAIKSEYVHLAATAYPPVSDHVEALPVLSANPTDRKFVVIGQVIAEENEWLDIPYQELLMELRKKAAAAGGQALLNPKFDTWVNDSFKVKRATADVIRYLD